jgi:8-oxo-dGTP diphosphatase
MDTNVRRVLRLFFGQNLHDAELKQIANEACPSGKSREFSQGMMDFATLTMSKKVTNKKITPSIRTQKALKRNSDKPIFRVAAAILWRKNEKNIEILIQTRPGSHHAVHEFPGGKIESGESERACLKRELMEEIGIEASVRPPFLRTEYIFDDKVIYFSWHRCQILLGEPYGKEGQEIRWIRISELCHYVFPPSNDEVIRSLAS